MSLSEEPAAGSLRKNTVKGSGEGCRGAGLPEEGPALAPTTDVIPIREQKERQETHPFEPLSCWPKHWEAEPPDVGVL